MYSYHNFMFPFRFDKVSCEFNGDDRHEFYKAVEFDKRVIIDTEFQKSLEKDNWIYKKFEIKNNLDYNEFVYFHDFVKDSIYNLDDFKKNATSYFFEKKDITDKFNITLKDGKEYNLKLTSISLRIFDTGIGILSFEVENYDFEKLDDILKINDFGRRVFPQFVGKNFDLSGTRDAFLPSKIVIDKYEENFENFIEQKNSKPFVKIGSHILGVLGDTFSQKISDKKYLIQPIIDDRMFVVCWYGDNKKVESIIKDEYILRNEDLYKYIFVDGGNITIKDKEMQKELMKKSLYTRWKEDYHTLYGITRYSFVCMSQRNEYTKNVLPLPHMKTMYYQMAIILLTTRASILRFSDEVTAISDIDKNDNPSDRVENLYKNYLRFKNKLYFKEITAQDQGIELYDKAREIMRIDSDISDLSQEISSLNSFAFFLDEKDEKKEMNKLTKVATYFMPATLVAGILGMNVFGDWMGKEPIFLIIGLIFVLYVTLNPQKIIDLVIKDNDSK